LKQSSSPEPKPQAELADRHQLYQESVQAPESELRFITQTFERLRGRTPTSLREDFCGTALAACQWVALSPAHTAVAVDLNAEVLDWGATHNRSALSQSERARLLLVQGDVRSVRTRELDVIQAFNFSYWIFTERRELLAYFRALREQLMDDGAVFLDVFGGPTAQTESTEIRELGQGACYEWQQRNFNPISAEMDCAIHFSFADGSRLDDAFRYHWRVWGARELRELLTEAGFAQTLIYRQDFDSTTNEPVDHYIADENARDCDCYLAYLVALK
jgi:hypothetical protein